MRILIKRILVVLIGFVIIGFAVACLRVLNLGMDPFAAASIGLSNTTGLALGLAMMTIHMPAFILTLWKRRKYINVGTVLGMFVIGYVIDFFYYIAFPAYIIETDFALWVRLVILPIILIILSIGAAVYMAADIGLTPFDAFGVVIEELTNGKLKFKWIRIGQEAVCTVVAIFLGATIGIATAMTVLCLGPFISFFRYRIRNFADKHIFV